MQILRYIYSCVFFLLVCTGCAEKGAFNNTKEATWIPTQAKAKWFKAYPQTAQRNEKGEVLPHPFFDLAPFISMKDKTLNFVVTTPSESPVQYGMDIVTGKRYAKHRFCRQQDIWKNYKGDLFLPPYTEGVIPRILDQIGKPQKIYVFGRENYYKENQKNMSHKVRVIGGVVEQQCEKPPCLTSQAWLSRMVIVAVDPADFRFENVKNLGDLKEKVDWRYVKAFMQNANGRVVTPMKDLPAYRIIGEIRPGFTLKFMMNFSKVFQTSELKKIRGGCLKLYTKAWEDFGDLIISSKKNQRSSEKNKEKAKLFFSFNDKYSKEFQTCTDFVRYTDLRSNPDKHWFLTYLTGFYKLQRLGYYYNCSKKMWAKNPLDYNGKRLYNPQKEIKNCTMTEFDRSFPTMIDAFTLLKANSKEYYRFVDYDNHGYGTHERIYSWVNVNHKHFRCRSNGRKYSDNLHEFDVFPKDVKWNSYKKKNILGRRKY